MPGTTEKWWQKIFILLSETDASPNIKVPMVSRLKPVVIGSIIGMYKGLFSETYKQAMGLTLPRNQSTFLSDRGEKAGGAVERLRMSPYYVRKPSRL